MHTGINRTRVFGPLIFLLLSTYTLVAQDSVKVKGFQEFWTKPRIVPKIGGGVQETAFVEAGIQLHRIYVHPLSLASVGPYLTVDAVTNAEDLIIGPKVGYELCAGLIGIAADVTYYSDFDRESVVFTPKLGLSVLGFANLFYGRNVAISKDEFRSIARDRFSLVFNINKDYFDIREAKRHHPRKR